MGIKARTWASHADVLWAKALTKVQKAFYIVKVPANEETLLRKHC